MKFHRKQKTKQFLPSNVQLQKKKFLSFVAAVSTNSAFGLSKSDSRTCLRKVKRLRESLNEASRVWRGGNYTHVRLSLTYEIPQLSQQQSLFLFFSLSLSHTQVAHFRA
jgi:hypothetical protein